MADTQLQQPIIIWLDGTFQGDNSPPMQRQFQTEITSPTTNTSDQIDVLLALNYTDDRVTTGKVVEIAPTIQDAYGLIEKYRGRRVFFVSSGTLGRTAIPHIVNNCNSIVSFYIFCASKANHVEWAINYASRLRMYTHQTDLLVKLMRDISEYFINYGDQYFKLGDADIALKYFRHAQYLEKRANELDKAQTYTITGERSHPQPDRRKYLDLLESESGLIRKAERIIGIPRRENNDAMET